MATSFGKWLAPSRDAATDSPALRAAFAILVLLALCAVSAPMFVDLIQRGAPRATAGRVDFSAIGSLDRPVQLRGEWMLRWRRGASALEPVGIMVPGSWAGRKGPTGEPLPQSGAATYELLISGLAPGDYSLHLPPIYAATRVWVNGKLASQAGHFGTSIESTRYVVRAQDVPISLTTGNLDLRIDVASFHHRDNGIEGEPVLGLAGGMAGWTSLNWAKTLLFPASLFLIAAYGLIVFLFRRSDRASLFLALSFLAAVPIGLIFSHDNILSIALPFLEFRGLVAIQYLCGIISVGFFVAYIHALFPKESPSLFFWVLEGAYGLLLVGQTFFLVRADTLQASFLSQIAEPLRLATFLYLIGIAAVAAARRREGALVFLIGISGFLIMISMRALVTNGFLSRDQAIGVDFTPIGILVFLFSQIIILAERWSLAITAAERMSDHLRRLLDVNSSITREIRLEELLRKIVQVTSKIVQADRSSLFLHDQKTEELWSVVAEGVEEKRIRFSSTLGLAGHSFTHGEVLNVTRAYEDPRFNREIDVQTGYKTGSILSLPVVARDGRRLGVMQALNRRSRAAFDDHDIERMKAFVAQAAIAIDNATLFAEVTAARKYNESILASMSSGVITIDQEGQIAKLNQAACSILGLDEEDVQDKSADQILTRQNPWLGLELEEVRQAGSAKTLVDVDFVTLRDDRISVNLSIVPLVAEGDAVGILMLIEDISEGKRLQGAMRRFMTQEVVDQVLQRKDQLLFGSACKASVLFADIRNFTSMAERLAPRETVDMLNEIFTELFEAVSLSGGVLDKFIGDAIMAVYGAPLSTGRDAESAVESALQMFRMLEVLNTRRDERQLSRLRLGIGVATGEVVAGTIGSPKRMDYTVIGDSVNLASRLQDLTKHYGVELVVCQTTAAAVRQKATMRELDLIRVRGRKKPAKIFQILLENVNGCAERQAAFEAYQKGRELLAQRSWTKAAAAFEEAFQIDPSDTAAAIMLKRARSLRRRAPGLDWDGVWVWPK